MPQVLADAGVLDGRVLAAHSIWLSPDDLDVYAAHDVAVAHCPQSNAKLASGVAPVTDLLARGVRVGLGTDGPASNNDLDLWEEMRLAAMLARLPRAATPARCRPRAPSTSPPAGPGGPSAAPTSASWPRAPRPT